MMCHAGFGGVQPESGAYYCFLETFGGGYGGAVGKRRPRRGADARAEHRERPDRGDRAELSGTRRAPLARRGLGRRRGASAEGSVSARTTSSIDRRRSPSLPTAPRTGPLEPSAVTTGCPPSTSSSATAASNPSPPSARSSWRKGDVVSYRTCGGGGYGPPEERDPGRVLRDVCEGKVSSERARSIYRVAIEGRQLDESATKELRS